MSEINENEKIKYLVADTTAFINAVPLNQYAENVLTVPDVIKEVRNKRQIRRLCVLPFDLQVREPRTESVKYCVEFAKKTGDYASLSGIDLKVIALTYELEADHVGTSHLRSVPVVGQVIASKEKPVELQDNTKLPGWYEPENDDKDSEYSENNEESNTDSDDEDEDEEEEKTEHQNQVKTNKDTVKEAIEKQLCGETVDNDIQTEEKTIEELDDYTEEELERAFTQLNCEENNCVDLLQPQNQKQEVEEFIDKVPKSVHPENNDDEDDDSSWITPSNIKQVKKALEGKVEEDRVPHVSCMSTDFALQNVLKQMNLNISALNGRVIKQLRTYILRCYACYKTTSIMTKVFCPNCGNKTLKRVAVSLDENGKQVIHINIRRPLTTKYKNQSLPRFQGGKHSRNPILFEDQPIPRQMPSRVAKTKTNALDEDFIAGMSPFVMRDLDSKSAMLRAKGNLKEWARNNNFEEDRRRKHYNRLYK